tara:strand:- start:99 stop:380 length:282 start_codon:yes stop_codon:yes gene_type:complete
MKVIEIMERAGMNQTGRAISYIKDALEEINKISETVFKNEKIDITENQRFYDIPNEALKVLDIRCKNHLNDKDEYRTITRLIHEPPIKDADGS